MKGKENWSAGHISVTYQSLIRTLMRYVLIWYFLPGYALLSQKMSSTRISIDCLFFSSFSSSVSTCKTEWFDRDNPSGQGDFEVLNLLRNEFPNRICVHPIDCEVETTSGVPASQTGQNIQPYVTKLLILFHKYHFIPDNINRLSNDFITISCTVFSTGAM